MASNFYMSELSTKDKAKFLSITGGMLDRDAQHDIYSKMALENRKTKMEIINLKKQFEEEKDQLEGSNQHLTRNLKIAESKVAELTEQTEALTILNKDTVKSHAKKLEHFRIERANTEQEMKQQIIVLEERLATLEAYEKLKQEFEEQIHELKEKLRQQTQDTIEKIQELERKVQDTHEKGERRRRHDVKNVREEMESKLERMLDSTTKTTIEENSRLTTELHYLSHRVTKLLDENKTCTKENKFLKRELESTKEMAAETTKRVRFFQRLYEQMKEAAKVEMAAKLEEQELERLRILEEKEREELDRKDKEEEAKRLATLKKQQAEIMKKKREENIIALLPNIELSEETKQMSSALNKLNVMLESRKTSGKNIINRCKEKNEKLLARAGRELKVSTSADGLTTMSQPHPPTDESGVKYVKWTSSVPKVDLTLGAELVK